MRTVPAESLKKLPEDVASLVSQGVYSLFELVGSSASYLLTTPHPTEYYLLDDEGGITLDPAIKSLTDARRGVAISLVLPESSKTNFAGFGMHVGR